MTLYCSAGVWPMKSEQRAAVIEEITEALDPREVIEIYSEALLEIGCRVLRRPSSAAAR